MFDNWNGAFYSVFNGVGQRAPIILSSGIAYGGTKAIGTAGARLLGKEALTGLEAGLTASKISNVAAKVSYQTGLLMGSVESMGAYRQQMKNMGVDDFTSAKWSVPFAMATYVSEIALGKNIVASWYGRNLGGGIRKEVQAATKTLEKDVLQQTGKKIVDLPKETQNKYMNSFWKKLMDKRSKFNAWSTSGNGWKGKAKEAFVGAGQEAFEENPIEATMDYGLESWYNSAVVGQLQNILHNIGGNTYTKEPAVYEGIDPRTGQRVRVEKGEAYYRNTPSGQKQSIDKALWEAEQLDIANAKKVIDKGEMMFDDPGGNFSLDQPLSAFISTLLTFGLGSAVTSTGLFNSDKAKKSKEQSDNLSNLAYKIVTDPKKYSRAVVENELNNLQKETKVYGRDFVTIDNDVLVPGDTRPSEAQARIKLIMDELDLKVNAIQTHGLGSPSATTAMAGDNELINKATSIATQITALEERRTKVEEGTEQEDIVEIDKELEGLKMELNDYIVPKDGPNGKQKSIAYTRKNVKIEYFKYFLENQAKKSTEKQLESKKDKLSSSEYQKEYDKVFDQTYKTYIRNADTILLNYKANYDSFYNSYVKDFEQQSSNLTDAIDAEIAEQLKKYKEQDVVSLTKEKLQNVHDIISKIPDISTGDISNVTMEVKDHFDNVKGIIGELHQMVKIGSLDATVLNNIKSITEKFKNIVNDYATTKTDDKESGGLSDKLTDMQISGIDYTTAIPENELVSLGLHVGNIQKEINVPESDKVLFNALLGDIENKPIVLYDSNGKVALETTVGKIINTYSGYVGSKIPIPNPAEALNQVMKVEEYLEARRNYIDINRNFFQEVIESDPNKTEHSFLHLYS